MCVSAMEGIEKRPVRPEHFSDHALVRAKRLAGIATGPIQRVEVKAKVNGKLSKPVHVTQQVATNVDELIGPRHISIGALEGRLELLSIHRGIYIHIYDLVTGRAVRCDCDRQTLTQLASHLGKRLLVFGEIYTNAKGDAVSVTVESYRVLREREELPQIEDVKGIIPSGSEAEEEVDLGAYLRDETSVF